MLAPNDDLAPQVFRPRAIIDTDGTVEGYASLFGAIDQARDMVMPGAFRQTLALRGARRVPMLFQHDPAEPIGIWLDLHEDERGLLARGRLIPEVARSRELYALLKAGAVDGLSIGFKTVKGRLDPRSRIRKLDQVELWEISIVTFPLLAGARVSTVKGGQDRDERLLRRHPRLSFARSRAEQEWKSVSTAARLESTTSVSGTTRLDTVRAKRDAPLRRDRIRGWIADDARRSTADLKRLFAQPGR